MSIEVEISVEDRLKALELAFLLQVLQNSGMPDKAAIGRYAEEHAEGWRGIASTFAADEELAAMAAPFDRLAKMMATLGKTFVREDDTSEK